MATTSMPSGGTSGREGQTTDAARGGPTPVNPVAAYLEQVADPACRAVLGHVRDVVLQEAPDAQPVTSYNLPAFRDAGTGGILCGFAATARGCSLYPFSGSVVALLAERLTGFTSTKGSIHFTPSHPLPDAVIREVVRLRRAEIGRRGR